MKRLVTVAAAVLVLLTGCATIPHYGPEGDETEAILWFQAYNLMAGIKKAYFARPEFWIVGLDGKRRPAISDANFALVNKSGDWGGSYYPSRNGPVGNTIPSAQVFDTKAWQSVPSKSAISVTVDKADHYYDLWHVRFKIKPGEYILVSVMACTKGDVRVRIGVDLWAQDPATGRDTTNRPVFTEWYSGSEWKMLRIPAADW